MADTKQERFPDYPIFKGLQRPLEFFGLQGRYIYWAAATAGRSRCGFHPRLLHLRFRGRTRAASPRRSCRWRSHRHEAAQGLAQQEE